MFKYINNIYNMSNMKVQTNFPSTTLPYGMHHALRKHLGFPWISYLRYSPASGRSPHDLRPPSTSSMSEASSMELFRPHLSFAVFVSMANRLDDGSFWSSVKLESSETLW